MKLFKGTQSFRLLAVIAIITLSASVRTSPALENGLGRIPAMGYNPWNSFLVNFNISILKEIIDSMESYGMREAGYIYACTDGGGSGIMNTESLTREFINYAHQKGFKAGLYVNNNRGNELANVTKWTNMGFDYLKHDDFWVPWWHPTYNAMRSALKSCGRDVYYTIHFQTDSGMPQRPDTMCNAMRVANDINWKKDSLYWGPTNNNGLGVMGEVAASRKLQDFAKPGYFNDMDMMGIGMTKFITTVEAQTHFNFWCILASILLEGSDLRRIPKDRLEILLNREVIAVNQDSLGIQGRLVWSKYATGDSTEVISKKMKDSSRAVMLFNRHGSTKSITVKLSDIGLSGQVYVRDLLRHVNLPLATDSVTIPEIVQHGSTMLRISKSPITNVYHQSLKKSSAVHTPMVRLLNTRTMSRIQLSAGHTGLEIYNLQGVLIWEVKNGSMEQGGGIQIPASLRSAGTVVVRFVNGKSDLN